MSATTLDILDGRIPFPQVQQGLGYNDRRQAQVFLDNLHVPFVVVRRQRFYRPEDVRAAIDRHTQLPEPDIGSDDTGEGDLPPADRHRRIERADTG